MTKTDLIAQVAANTEMSKHQPVTLGVVGSSPIRVATSGAKASTYFETCFQGII